MRSVYEAALFLFPSDFRAAFGAAMRRDFAQLLREARARGAGAAAWLGLREVASVLGAAAREWMAKAFAAPFQRELIFRDHSRMRPPGASKAFWYTDL